MNQNFKKIGRKLKLNRVADFFKHLLYMPPLSKNNDNRVLWVEKTLRSLPADRRLLDAGAGEQQYKKFCNHLNYVSQDFSQYSGQGDNAGLQMGKWNVDNIDIVSDITTIPEEDNSFDYIMCTEVFEHLPDPISAIKEFSRLLKQGGELLITAPFCSFTHFSPYHYYTGFNRYFYETILPQYGFKIIELVRNGNYFDYVQQEIHRIPEAVNRYTNKKLNLYQIIVLRKSFNILNKLSMINDNSSEMACFGYHVRAKKEHKL